MEGVLVLASQQRIIGNNPVTWLCDQDSVKYFMDSPPPEQKRLRRWWVFLSQLRLAVHHIQGLKNELSDYLSRNSFDERLGQSSEEMAEDAFAKMDVQLDLFMKTTQPQNKWGKEELLKDYAAIMKQLQPGQVKLIADEQWAMTKDALYKEDRVCVPESHLEETLRWRHTVNGHPAVQRSLWFFDRHFHCNKNESEKKRSMTEVTKDCHCILGKHNSQVDRGEMGNLPIPHMVNSVVYLDFMHLPHYAGHNFALMVTCGLSRFARVFPMNKKADSETVLKTLFEEWIQVYGLPKVIHSDQDVRLTAAGNWYRGVLETLYALSTHQERPLREANPLLQNSDADPHGAGEGEQLVESPTVRNLPDEQPGVHAYWFLTARALLWSSWFPHGVSDAAGRQS